MVRKCISVAVMDRVGSGMGRCLNGVVFDSGRSCEAQSIGGSFFPERVVCTVVVISRWRRIVDDVALLDSVQLCAMAQSGSVPLKRLFD